MSSQSLVENHFISSQPFTFYLSIFYFFTAQFYLKHLIFRAVLREKFKIRIFKNTEIASGSKEKTWMPGKSTQ